MSTTPALITPFDPNALRDAPGAREALRRAGFHRAGVGGFLKGAHPEKDLPLLRRRAAAGGDAFHLAVRLFLLGETVPEDDLPRLFHREQVEQLAAAGLLERCGSPVGWRSVAQLAPAPGGDGLLLSDWTLDLAALADDHVLGVGAASDTLASLTPRRPFRRALDLGCGAGCQSLLAAAHCGWIVGTDISERALNFARLNARLNGAANVEFRAGSFFEPVAGERFDLLVANPPFVISPEHERVFRTGSARGDAVSEFVVGQAPAFLEDDGLAVILLNWHHQSDADWAERPLAWTAGNGCDTWLLRFNTDEPLVYAAEWLRTEGKTADAMGAALDRWDAYYRSLGIQQISAGVMVLRRRPGAEVWTRADTLAFGRHAGACGEHLERVVAGETYARAASDEAMLAGRFHLHPDHLVDTHLRLGPDGWTQSQPVLRPQPGLELAGRLDGLLLQVLARLDGTRSLAEVVALCTAASGLEAAAFAESCVGVVRKLLRAGFLVVPVEARG